MLTYHKSTFEAFLINIKCIDIRARASRASASKALWLNWIRAFSATTIRVQAPLRLGKISIRLPASSALPISTAIPSASHPEQLLSAAQTAPKYDESLWENEPQANESN